MRYVAGKYKVADHWFPEKDLLQNTRLLEYFGYHPTAIRKRGVEIFIDLVNQSIYNWASSRENLSSGFATTCDSNRTAQLLRLARVL